MEKQLSKIVVLGLGALFAVVLAACGGGGGGSSVVSKGGGGNPTPQPTATGRAYQVHFVVGLSSSRFTEVVPGNGNNGAVLPRSGSFTDGGPLAGAKIAYPDGSVQTADGNGVFLPSASSYGQKNQKMLQTNPGAQPLVIVSDPAGKARPATARVAAYASATVATSSVVRSKLSNAMGTVQNLAGVTLLQPTSSIFSSDMLDLDVQGSDVDNNVVDLSTTQISYASAAGGTIVPIAGSTEAYYFPPALGSGSMTDSITVTVTVPNTQTQFTASNNVVVVAASNAVQIAGSMQSANGTPMPNGVALFAQLSKYFPPNYWLAAGDDSGNYSAAVPANQLFNIIVGAPPSFSPNGNFAYFVGSSTADGSVTSYSTGAPGLASLDLFLPASPIAFSNAPAETLPPFVSEVRDAWYNTVDATQTRIFDANTGIQPLLASIPGSFPSPAMPAPIGTGELAKWCYQWELVSGAPTLVIAEATGANCTQPGNDGYAVTPGASAGSFSYAKYTSNTSYAMNTPLDVATNALLVRSGTWTQTLTGTPSSITADNASVQVQIYDVANQVFGSPVYNETLDYAYSVDSGGLSTEQYGNDTRSSASDGGILAVYNATKTQTTQLSNCEGTPSACYSISGSVQEHFDPASGAFTSNYSISSSLNGDGSAALTYQSAADSSRVVIPLAPEAQQNSSPYCLVCSGNAAGVFDVDGVTQIGSFTVNNARLVQFLVLDPAHGGVAVDTLGFIL